MRKFIFKLIRFLSIGILPSLLLYTITDPFKVLHHYDSFVDPNAKALVPLNQDYVSTTTFINNSSRIKYNSFIFGNSRSIFYQIPDWKKHLDKSAACYHFDASGEGLFGITKKIEFINKKGIRIENVLLILDYGTLIQDKPQSGHLYLISPALVNYSNIIQFHKAFFFAFLNPKFLLAYLDFKIFGSFRQYMKQNFLLDDRPRNYDASTNELRFDFYEDLIKENNYYTPQRLSVFYSRDTTVQQFSPPCIFESQKTMLGNIHAITKKHNTSIKIVINPLYDQLKLNKDDLKYLKNLFGAENVFDFSGINKFTNNYQNYYEASHYRPHVSRELMEIIYDQTSQSTLSVDHE